MPFACLEPLRPQYHLTSILDHQWIHVSFLESVVWARRPTRARRHPYLDEPHPLTFLILF